MGKSVDRLLDLIKSAELSDHMFWSWQDLRQYSRIDGEIRDGVLESGVVTETRELHAGVWTELCRFFEGRRYGDPVEQTDQDRVTRLLLRRVPFGP